MKSLPFAFAMVSLLCGCKEATTSVANPHIVVGTIDIGGTLETSLVGPSVGAVGEKLSFTVTTYGSACYSPAGADVINQGLQMTIVPYDAVLDGPCDAAMHAMPREVVVVFDRGGDAVLRLQGQTLVGRNPVVVTRPMQIRP